MHFITLSSSASFQTHFQNRRFLACYSGLYINYSRHRKQSQMVLHNDKWKYKAKRNYERKHNIKPAGKSSAKEGTSHGRVDDGNSSDQDGANDSLGSSFNSENESDSDGDDGYGNKGKKSKPKSNSWRFEDPIVDESILKDPEYIARLNAIKAEEENRAAFMRSVVSEKLKNADIHDEDHVLSNDISSRPTAIKNMKKFKQNDLQKWKFEEDNSDTDSVSFKPEVREFTPEEREKFLTLQKKINHQKELDKIRNRMDLLNNKIQPGRARVLELQSKTGTDNYRAIVDKSLQHAHDNVDTDELDDLVEKMVGVDLKSQKESVKDQPSQFDLNTLLQQPIGAALQASPDVAKVSNRALPMQLETDELDDFLDSVL